MIDKQAELGFAQALGGGLVAAIDGMRFVVPVPSIYTRPNKKYFGFRRDGGPRPEVLVTDTGSYSDVVFGLVHLLGVQDADNGALSRFARGKIDLERIKRYWSDILRIVVSVYTGEIRACDVLRMIQRGGNPTPLGEAIAHYGRIFKSLGGGRCRTAVPVRPAAPQRDRRLLLHPARPWTFRCPAAAQPR